MTLVAVSGDCMGLTPSVWVRLMCRPHICSLPAVCLVPSEISNIRIEGVALINLWSLFFS